MNAELLMSFEMYVQHLFLRSISSCSMSANLTGMDGILCLLDSGCMDRSEHTDTGEAGAPKMLQASEG